MQARKQTRELVRELDSVMEFGLNCSKFVWQQSHVIFRMFPT